MAVSLAMALPCRRRPYFVYRPKQVHAKWNADGSTVIARQAVTPWAMATLPKYQRSQIDAEFISTAVKSIYRIGSSPNPRRSKPIWPA